MKLVEIEHPRKEEWKEAAGYLRELADRFEKGEILECAIVINDKAGACFESWGHFEDRWRLLGALEYAKAGVSKR